MTMIRLPWIVLPLALLTAAKAPAQFASTSFYLVAHQDDWQYFMGKDAWQDLVNPERKVVFIYLTAGDACNGTGTCSSGIPYFAAREEGAKNSIYLAALPGRNPEEVSASSPNPTVWFDDHPVARWRYRNAVNYFFRLPDGRAHRLHSSCYTCGLDLADSSYVNLFRRGILRPLSDITGSSAYRDWEDLAETVVSVLRMEKSGADIFLHTHEFSQSLNPSSHPDHREAGLLADFARKQIPGMVTYFHLDYVTGNMEKNLTKPESETEINLFSAYDAAKTNFGCPSDRNLGDLEWCTRNYISRTEKTIQPTDESEVRHPFYIEFIPGDPGFISLSVDLPAPDRISCTLCDLTGKIIPVAVGRSVAQSGNYRFQLIKVPRGVYLLIVSSATGRFDTGKIYIN
jgi:hypothetical protein